MAKSLVPKDGWEPYILSLTKSLREKYGQRNDDIDEIREHRAMEKEVRIPEEYKKTAAEHRGPYIYRFLDRVTSLLAHTFPTAKVLPLDPTDEEQRKSSKREKWFNEGVYPLMSETEDVFLKFVDSTVADGTGVLKCLLQKHRWDVDRDKGETDEDFNKKVQTVHRRNFPFVWRNVDTKAWFPLYDDFGLAECVEVYERAAAPLLRRYRLTARDLNLNEERPGNVTYIEYWNRTHAVYMVHGKKVKTIKHNYGRVPYFEAQANVGKNSLAFPLKSLQDTFNSFVTIMLNYAYYAGFPIPALEQVDPDAALPVNTDKEQVRLVQGETAVPPDGYKYVFLQYPDLSGEIHGLVAMLKEIMDEVSLAPILYGLPPGSDISGAALHPLIAIAKAVLGPATASIARAFNEQAAFMLEIIEKILKEPVPVYVKITEDGKVHDEWLEQGPDDIKHYYKVVHTLQPVIPAERQLNTMYLASLNAQGIVDKRYVREEGSGISSPEEMADRVWLEAIEERPEFQGPLLAEFQAWLGERGPIAGFGTPETPPVGPGGPGVAQMPGVQQPLPGQV